MATLTLQPAAAAGLDTVIRNDLPTSNYGTQVTFFVGEADNVSNSVRRSLIKFDLSGLPVGSTVTSATLALTISNDRSSNARTAEVFEVLRAWVEAEATWNIWSTGNNWTTAGCSSAGNDYVNTVLADASYTATETVNVAKNYAFNAAGLAWLEAVAAGTQTNNGWLIKMQTELNDEYAHWTSDEATASYRPQLTIEYTPAFVPRAMVY